MVSPRSPDVAGGKGGGDCLGGKDTEAWEQEWWKALCKVRKIDTFA